MLDKTLYLLKVVCNFIVAFGQLYSSLWYLNKNNIIAYSNIHKTELFSNRLLTAHKDVCQPVNNVYTSSYGLLDFLFKNSEIRFTDVNK